MKIGYLTHFHPEDTILVDLTKRPPLGGKAGTFYAEVSFLFWGLAYRLHLTDWPHPRFLTEVTTGGTEVIYDNTIGGKDVDCRVYKYVDGRTYEAVNDGWREIP